MTENIRIVPYGDRVLIRRDAAPTATTGGILLPDASQDRQGRPKFGTVLALGRGRRLEDGSIRPIDLRVGDRVCISLHCGVEIENPDVKGDVLIVAETDEIMGRVS